MNKKLNEVNSIEIIIFFYFKLDELKIETQRAYSYKCMYYRGGARLPTELYHQFLQCNFILCGYFILKTNSEIIIKKYKKIK